MRTRKKVSDGGRQFEFPGFGRESLCEALRLAHCAGVHVGGKGAIVSKPLSISDDDLCSDCSHCAYRPGELSTCNLDWPAKFNPDGYAVSCERFSRNINESMRDWQDIAQGYKEGASQ